MWTGSISKPELFNDWFRFQDVMLKGAPDIMENFRVRRCLIPFDSFVGKRNTLSPYVDYRLRNSLPIAAWSSPNEVREGNP
jgi:hypothetical protein